MPLHSLYHDTHNPLWHLRDGTDLCCYTDRIQPLCLRTVLLRILLRYEKNHLGLIHRRFHRTDG